MRISRSWKPGAASARGLRIPGSGTQVLHQLEDALGRGSQVLHRLEDSWVGGSRCCIGSQMPRSGETRAASARGFLGRGSQTHRLNDSWVGGARCCISLRNPWVGETRCSIRSRIPRSGKPGAPSPIRILWPQEQLVHRLQEAVGAGAPGSRRNASVARRSRVPNSPDLVAPEPEWESMRDGPIQGWLLGSEAAPGLRGEYAAEGLARPPAAYSPREPSAVSNPRNYP